MKIFPSAKKKVLVVADQNWLGFDYRKMKLGLMTSCKFRIIGTNGIVEEKATSRFALQELKLALKILEYEVCMELEIYPHEIDIDRSDHYSVACQYYAKLLAFKNIFDQTIKSFPPDLVIFLQGYPIEASFSRLFCRENNVPMLALENTFHSQRFVWESISGITVNRNQSLNFVWKYIDLVSNESARSAVRAYLDQIHALKAEEHTTLLKAGNRVEHKQNVLFLGQVFTDASTLFGINHFNTPIDVIEALVYECAEKQHHLILKLHPKELNGLNFNLKAYRSLTLRKIKERNGLWEMIEKNGFVVDYSELDTFDLIEKADVCVTINSQAGFEALLFGKELIVCGSSFYSGLGVTFNATEMDDLRYFLNEVLSNGKRRINREFVDKVFYIITEKYFVHKSEKQLMKLIFEQFR